MDNIQKAVVAVLGIAALAVFLIPEGVKNGAGDPSANGPIPLGPIPIAEENASEPSTEQIDGNSEDENSTEDDFGNPDEYETFGQPMNDARPLGANSDNSNNQDVQNNLPAGAIPSASSNSDSNMTDNGGQASTPLVDSARPSQ